MAFIRSEAAKGDEDYGITAIAIDDDKNSQFAVRWAVDNVVNSRNPYCILMHVQCKTLHLGEHAGTLSKEGRPPTQQELQQFFLPYRGFCARRGIQTKEIVLHDIDISSAIIDYIGHNHIANIVVGASHRNAITRKFKNPDIPSTVLKSAPESCAVYVISKGKVQTFRLATRSHQSDNSSVPTHHRQPSDTVSINGRQSSARQHHLKELTNLASDSPCHYMSQTSLTESWKSDGSDKASPDRSIDSVRTPLQQNYGFNFNVNSPKERLSELMKIHMDSSSESSEFSGSMSFRSADTSYENVEFTTASASSKNSNSDQLAHFLESEMKRLQIELQQSMELYSSFTKETVLAKQMVKELHRLQTLETRKSGEFKIPEGAQLTLTAMEKKKKKVALEAVQAAKQLAEVEKQKKIAEQKAQKEALERQKSVEAISSGFRCRRYTIDEIEQATDHFEASNKIGEGGYGPVFKGMLNHISVAIKVLRPDLSQGQKQFRQEVDVLSSMRHPHMVILLGACPEYGCLVYEYMENGSLEDRLYRKDKTPPIPWRTRFKIAYEIATALLFLHETKPEPFVHRDLKPANILLDYNYVSKIADVGLARLVPPSAADQVTQYHMTAAAGTFCYIDPEYQQTGLLGVKSDLFSFGVVLLQLLTARPPMGLSFQVEDAIEKGTFEQILDRSVKNWPVEEALSVAKIAIRCCELRKKDRPDLAGEVLPVLERLRNLAIAHGHIEPETIIPLSSPVDLISEAKSQSSEITAIEQWQQRFMRMCAASGINCPPKVRSDHGPPPPILQSRGSQSVGKLNILPSLVRSTA